MPRLNKEAVRIDSCGPSPRRSLTVFAMTQGDRYPVLWERCNIVVIADEAHFSQDDLRQR